MLTLTTRSIAVTRDRIFKDKLIFAKHLQISKETIECLLNRKISEI
jgi:hypothetical protein